MEPPSEYPRGTRGAAATRPRTIRAAPRRGATLGISARHPRRRRDPSSDYPRGTPRQGRPRTIREAPAATRTNAQVGTVLLGAVADVPRVALLHGQIQPAFAPLDGGAAPGVAACAAVAAGLALLAPALGALDDQLSDLARDGRLDDGLRAELEAAARFSKGAEAYFAFLWPGGTSRVAAKVRVPAAAPPRHGRRASRPRRRRDGDGRSAHLMMRRCDPRATQVNRRRGRVGQGRDGPAARGRVETDVRHAESGAHPRGARGHGVRICSRRRSSHGWPDRSMGRQSFRDGRGVRAAVGGQEHVRRARPGVNINTLQITFLGTHAAFDRDRVGYVAVIGELEA